MATNDVAMQNTFMLINNILPHKTCWKLGGKILNKCANFFKKNSTHGAPTLVDFCTNNWLKKNIIVRCPCGSDDVWIIANMANYTFVRVYFNMSSKFVKEYCTKI